MTLGSVLEIYTTYFGWAVYEVVWELVATTGIIYIPFIAAAYNAWRNPVVSSQRSHPTALVSLKAMQWSIYPMFFVLFFAGIPLMPLSLDSLEYPKVICSTESTEEVEGGITGTTFDNLDTPVEVPEGTPKIPLLWYVAMQINAGATRSVLAGISCFEDLTALDYKLRNITLDEEPLRREFTRFVNECFIPVKSRYIDAMADKNEFSAYSQDQFTAGVGTNWNANDPYFVGSKFYMQTEGFYRPCEDPLVCGLHRFRAKYPVEGWAYDSDRDADFSEDDIAAGIGKPYCDQWWNPDMLVGTGLKDRLVDAAKDVEVTHTDSIKEQVTNAVAWATARGFWSGWSEEDTKDLIIKRLLTSETIDFTGVDDIVDAASVVKNEDVASAGIMGAGGALMAAEFGLAMPAITATGAAIGSGGLAMAKESAGFYMWMYIAKKAAPMVQAILFMLTYIVLPIYLVITGFSFGGILSMLILWFVLRFFTILWVIGELLDAQLYAAMFPDASFIGSLVSLNINRVILDLVLSLLFLIGPVVLLGIVGMTGARIAFADGGGFMNPVGGIGRSFGRGSIKMPQSGKS